MVTFMNFRSSIGVKNNKKIINKFILKTYRMWCERSISASRIMFTQRSMNTEMSLIIYN